MANNRIKGLTVELNGDTTNLGKALDAVNKKTTSLSGELRDVNKLLKLDPGNMDALAQKQDLLSEAVEETSKKLKILKEAEKQVQQQFERGEVSEEQVRALQREIIATTAALKKHEQQAAQTAADIEKYGKTANDASKDTEETGDEAKKASKELDELADSADDAGNAGEGMGSKLAGAAKVGLGAVAAAAGAALGALVGSAEASREYRIEMGKLSTAYTTAGHSTEAATKTYQALQGILGETDQAVEAANHLALLANNEEDLAKWTDIATGVYAKFGASLPIENLTEASNETAKTGQLTGGLADALNWAGVNEDAFQASLDACTTEQQRQALITKTLNGLYSESAEQYRENNAEVIRANEANEALAASTAEVGAAVEPILTDFKLLGASLITDFLPGITAVTDGFRGLMNGDDGAADQIGEALGGLVTQLLAKVTEIAPAVVETATSLITTLVTTLVTMLPQLVTTGVTLITTILDGVTSAIPTLTQAIVDMIPELVNALVTGIPMLIEGAVELLLAILEAIPKIIPPLVEAIPQIVLALIDGLLTAIPQLIEGALAFLLAIVDAIPLLISQLAPQIPKIITAVVNGLVNAQGAILNAALQLLLGVVKAIPKVVVELVKALPQIWNAIKTNLEELPEKMANIGKDLVRGLANGIKDMGSWLKGKIGEFTSKVVKDIKGFFGIKSPSRETAYMGRMLSEGLAVGVEESADEPIKAMEDLSDDMLNAGAELNGITLERNLNHSFTPATATNDPATGIMGKLDRILQAIQDGHILAIDGDALVGATIDRYDNALGTRAVLAIRGARS